MQQIQLSSARRLWILSAVAAVAIAIGLYFALVFAGTDMRQGNIQRIFYVHLPAFFVAGTCFGLAVIGSIAYFRTKQARWERFVLAAIEIGVVFALINLVTGSIWAKPTWNTWWTWDARLTSMAAMFAAYMAFLFFQRGISSDRYRYLFTSIYPIFAFLTVIYTIVVTRLRDDGIHPIVIGQQTEEASRGIAIDPNMRIALMVNIVVWVLIVLPVLFWWRTRLAKLTAQNAVALEQ